MVFLHGSAVSGRMWLEHMRRLDGFHCLAPDLPGFGRSNRLPWLSRIETANLIAELIESRILARKVHLVALSWGGSIAHELVARRPDLLDRVLIDGCGVSPSFAFWPNVPFLAGIAAVTPFIHTRPVIELMNRSVGGAFQEEDKADIRAASKRAFRGSFFEGFTTKLTRAEVAAPCPTLLVAGEEETAVRPSNGALAALMPNAVARYVPGTGHGWLGAKPELHYATVKAWLSGAALPDGLAVETMTWPKAAVDRALRRTAEA